MVPEYLDLVLGKIKQAGVADEDVLKDAAPLGSSDLGATLAMPIRPVNIMFKVAPKNVALHEDAMLKIYRRRLVGHDGTRRQSDGLDRTRSL